MKIVLTFFCFFISLISFVYADGEDYVLVSNIGTSARGIAIGGVEGFSRSADSIFENPAGLNRVESGSLSLFTTTVMDEVEYKNVALAQTTFLGTLALGYMQAAVIDIPETALDSENKHVIKNTFNYSSELFKVSYANELLRNFYAGLSYSYYATNYYSLSGEGGDVDLGFLLVLKSYEVSLLFKNILPGAAVAYSNGYYERLPSSIITSAKFKLPGGVDYLLQTKLQQRNLLGSFGLRYNPSFLPVLSFSMGYKQFLTVAEQFRQKGSIGLGLTLFGTEFHYAYERSDYVLSDHKNYFSINFTF